MGAAVTAVALPAHGQLAVRLVDAADTTVAEQHFAVVSGAMDAEHAIILSEG
jgi:hypothetical protein